MTLSGWPIDGWLVWPFLNTATVGPHTFTDISLVCTLHQPTNPPLPSLCTQAETTYQPRLFFYPPANPTNCQPTSNSNAYQSSQHSQKHKPSTKLHYRTHSFIPRASNSTSLFEKNYHPLPIVPPSLPLPKLSTRTFHSLARRLLGTKHIC